MQTLSDTATRGSMLHPPSERHRADPRDYVSPADHILADHDRLRHRCEVLEDVASDPDHEDAPEQAAYILRFLRTELPLHLQDEERDLYPCLQKRCVPPDELDNRIAQLQAEDMEIRHLQYETETGLMAIVAGQTPNDLAAFRLRAHRYAELVRHRVSLENSTILPLIRKRLTASDAVDLGRRFAARHGVAYFG